MVSGSDETAVGADGERPAETDSERPRVGVVGAGITGLALTHYLREHDADVVTFEASDRPGGVVHSRTVDGAVIELGPQRLRLAGPLGDLVDELGLQDDVVAADTDSPLYVYAGGALGRVPLSASTLLSTDLLSWRGKLRLLAEPLTDAGDPAETAAALFRRKFGDEAYENVVGPLFGGIYASDPAEMPAGHALAGLLRLEQREGSLLRPAVRRLVFGGDERPPPAVLAGGNERLPGALYDRNDDVVELDSPVDTARETDDGYELVVDGDAVAVDRVVVTAPAHAAADVLADVADGVGGLADLTYNPLAMVYLRADHDRAGLGYQVRHDEPLHTLGVSWNGPAFGGPDGDPTRSGVHTAFLGGMTDGDVLARSDAELGELAREEFERVVGAAAEVVHVARPATGFPAYDGTWAALEDLELPDGVHLATNYTARMGVPSRVREASRLAATIAADD
jgi:oxygen-dependent protoporphyrinogen oxidase